MTAARVEHVGLGRGLGVCLPPRQRRTRLRGPARQRRAVIARVQGAEGERTAVKRERSAFRAGHARGTARVPCEPGGSFDETDPDALKASSETVEEASEGEGSMTEVALWVGAATLFGSASARRWAGKAEEYFSVPAGAESVGGQPVRVRARLRLLQGAHEAAAEGAELRIGGGDGDARRDDRRRYEAVTNFKPVLLVFAGILIFSSYKLITEEEEEEEDMSENAIKFCSNLLPVSEEYDGDNFFTEVRNDETGEMIKMATPLLLCLCVIELSDVVFAVDSIPAVFGVTQDPFIVYSSNIFAILAASFFALSPSWWPSWSTCRPPSPPCWASSRKMVAEFGGVEVSTEARRGRRDARRGRRAR